MILCSGTLGRITFREKAEAAAAAGFDTISIYSSEHDADTRSILDACGLTVAELDGPLAWLPGQPGLEPTRALDIAASIGARSVTVLETTGQELDAGRAATALNDLCELAAPLGLVMHIEPFAWSGIATLTAATTILERAAHPNGGILLDTWHVLRGPDGGVIDPAAVPWVVAIQVSDPSPSPLPSLRDDCLTNREWPGEASAAVVRQLRAMACHAPLEVERFGQTVDARSDARAAAAAHAWLVNSLACT